VPLERTGNGRRLRAGADARRAKPSEKDHCDLTQRQSMKRVDPVEFGWQRPSMVGVAGLEPASAAYLALRSINPLLYPILSYTPAHEALTPAVILGVALDSKRTSTAAMIRVAQPLSTAFGMRLLLQGVSSHDLSLPRVITARERSTPAGD
jgi:hypothetical protein